MLNMLKTYFIPKAEQSCSTAVGEVKTNIRNWTKIFFLVSFSSSKTAAEQLPLSASSSFFCEAQTSRLRCPAASPFGVCERITAPVGFTVLCTQWLITAEAEPILYQQLIRKEH